MSFGLLRCTDMAISVPAFKNLKGSEYDIGGDGGSANHEPRTTNREPVTCSTARGYTTYPVATGTSKSHVMEQSAPKRAQMPKAGDATRFLTFSDLVAQAKAQ